MLSYLIKNWKCEYVAEFKLALLTTVQSTDSDWVLVQLAMNLIEILERQFLIRHLESRWGHSYVTDYDCAQAYHRWLINILPSRTHYCNLCWYNLICFCYLYYIKYFLSVQYNIAVVIITKNNTCTVFWCHSSPGILRKSHKLQQQGTVASV